MQHPDVAMAKPLAPEPKFFLVDTEYARGLAAYSRTYFAGIPDNVVAGEKSTNYLESSVAARRIAHSLPRVKMVFILRDPVERAYSNWRWSTANGLETLDFLAALDAEPQRDKRPADAHQYSRPHAYASRGMYAELLAPYLELLGRSRVKVVRMEGLVGSTTGLADVHDFLGVTRRPDDAHHPGVVNAAPSAARERAAVPDDIRPLVASRFSAANEDLARLLGPAFTIWGSS
jgi:hypothetical protein